jgi:MFS family permease
MQGYRSNLWKLYLASILGGFAFFYNGVDTLYFRHFELSFEQVGFLLSATMVATLIFEIPTGSFADIYGKKHSIVIGSLATLAGLGCLAFGSTFGIFTIGFILIGIGRAFQSGAASALLYDVLSAGGRQAEYIKHQSRMQAAFIGIDIISGSVGFLLFSINVRIPFVISFVAMALVIIVQSTIKEVRAARMQVANVFARHASQIKEGFAITFRSRAIVWLTGFSLIYFIAGNFFGAVLNLPFLQEFKGFTTTQLAIMGLIWNTIQTTLVFLAGSIEHRLGRQLSLAIVVLLIPAQFAALMLSNNYLLSAVIVGIYFGTASFREIIVDSYMNAQIDNSYRATVLSVNSMILSGVAIFVLPLLGNVIDTAGLGRAILFLSVGTLGLGGLSLILKRYLS